MYSKELYTGSDMRRKCLSLTYDDGPGAYTYEIAKFLHDQNIKATFFVVGKYAFHHQDILEKIAMLGHLIGNHTYEHPDMPFYLSINGEVHNQIQRTDAIIKNYIKDDIIYFRSPYGKWSPEVADELNQHILSTVNHVGPIHWDVGGIDCFYWRNGHTVEETVQKYVNDIEEIDHGIVVMHDEIADMDFLKEKNNTLELTKQLIPILIKKGYSFVRLDEIESIKKEAAVVFKFRLKGVKGHSITLSGNENDALIFSSRQNTPLSEISMVDLGHGKIALKAMNNLYFSLQDENNLVIANSTTINKNEHFHLIPLSSNQIALRAYNGNYLAKEKKSGDKLTATAQHMRGCERFTFSPVSCQTKKTISLRNRYKTIKRQLLYIKSKLLEHH